MQKQIIKIRTGVLSSEEDLSETKDINRSVKLGEAIIDRSDDPYDDISLICGPEIEDEWVEPGKRRPRNRMKPVAPKKANKKETTPPAKKLPEKAAKVVAVKLETPKEIPVEQITAPPKGPQIRTRAEWNAQTHTTSIVSITGYLLGVDKGVFESDTEPLSLEIFDALEGDHKARSVRALSRIRSTILKNSDVVASEMTYKFLNLDKQTNHFDARDFASLQEDGISIVKTNYSIAKYISDINSLVGKKIYACKDLYPEWIKWDYIKKLFIMPSQAHKTKRDVENTAKAFQHSLGRYPYQLWLNWDTSMSGNENVLYNDRKFLTLLYKQNRDTFTEEAKVTESLSNTGTGLGAYLEAHPGSVVIVDCENADPVKVSAMMKNLSTKEITAIKKVVLCDDVHTSCIWDNLEAKYNLAVERQVVERVSDFKSLVDLRITTEACRMFYSENVNSFVLISSDSDYWELVRSLPNATFLLMVEEKKCGVAMKSKLRRESVCYCDINGCTGGFENEVRTAALLEELNRYSSEHPLEISTMMREVYNNTMVNLTASEKRDFISSRIKGAAVKTDEAGNIIIRFE